ncbi:MAG TPA: FecR domain-containing protein [Polyangiaceae bacterium]|nr:FecR domain-containing protein [Polyangiaceae bacterium]
MTPAQTKPRGLVFVLVVCVALAALWSSACRKGSDTIATLGRVTGAAERDRRASVGSWEKAEEGATFVVGDGVRTAEASKAVIQLFDKSTLSLDPKTLVRFLDRPSGPKGAKLDVEMGEATLEAADEAVDVGLELGSARIEAHGKVRLVSKGASTRLEVVIGTVRFLSEKESFELRVGDAVDIQPDKGVDKVAAASASASASSASSAPPAPSAAPAASGALDADVPLAIEASGSRSSGPGVVDVLAGAGDSFVVHDPMPPTAIGFSASGCPAGALLTLNPGGKSRETVGKARVSAEFPSGSHRYVVSCLEANGAKGAKVAEGTISVVADGGLRKLARTAPLTSVDTDGRRYTVLYQTLLPKLSVRWPNAPPAASYVLSVQSSRGTRTFSSKAASYAFGSGVLAEGEHVLVFEGAGKRSKPTSIAIRFDNAAPTASLSSPADGSFAPGASVLVTGSALPGWSVAAGGRELAQDDQNRFSGEVAAPSAERALVIRFSQSGRGVHYYLRRSAR